MKRLSLLPFAVAILTSLQLFAGAKEGKVAQTPVQLKPPPKPSASATPGCSIESIGLEGRFEKENAIFKLTFKVEAERECAFELAGGDITCLESGIKSKGSGMWSFIADAPEATIRLRDRGYWLELPEEGEYEATFEFAAKVKESAGIRSCSFRLAPALMRNLKADIDATEVELDVNGALGLKRVSDGSIKGKSSLFTGLLSPEGSFSATWKRHLERAKTELVASATSSMVFEVFPGTVKVEASFLFKVIQGKLTELKLDIPKDLNIMNVSGQSIQDWQVLKGDGGASTLVVKLSREFESDYKLNMEAGTVLPDFPCSFSLPSITPQKALKVDGTLALGTNRAIRLVCERTEGLNQVDNVRLMTTNEQQLSNEDAPALPSRSLYTYQLSGGKWELEAWADNISPSCSLAMNCTMTVKDEDLSVKAMLDMDIKDAPMKELLIDYSDDLSVSKVMGSCTNPGDYELLKRDLGRVLRIPLKPETIGKTSIFMLFDKSIKNTPTLKMPKIRVEDMKSVRGHLMLAAGKGLSVQATDTTGLKEEHVGSAPVKEPGLQSAYMFKDASWGGTITVKRERSSLVAEAFHLASIGEGAVYCSSMFSCHLSGAPSDKVDCMVEPSVKNLSFTGKDIVDWKRLKEAPEGGRELWQVSLREKTSGDMTILATYELPLTGVDASARLGAICLANAESESGYIAAGSQRNLSVSSKELPEGSVRDAEMSELPPEYRKMVTNPLIKVWRCLKTPYWADVSIKPYESEKLLDAVADFSSLRTRIDRNGETQTEAEYRIKNSKLQFLSLRLPEGAKLWTLSVDDQERSPLISKGSLLIPLPRKDDINNPVKVLLRYTQKFPKLESTSSFALAAPSLDIESMLCTWRVESPDDYSFAYGYGSKGNMDADTPVQTAGFAGFVGLLVTFFSTSMLFVLAIPCLIMTLAFTILSCSSWSAQKARIPLRVMGTLFIVISVLSTYALLNSSRDVRRSIAPAAQGFFVNTLDFSKSFMFAGETAKVQFELEDMRGYSLMKLVRAGVSLLLALVALALALKSSRTPLKVLLVALALTLLVAAGSQWLLFSLLAALLASLLLPSMLLAGVISWILRRLAGLILSSRNAAAATALAMAALAIPSYTAQSEESQGVSLENISCKVLVTEKAVTVKGVWKIKSDGGGTLQLLREPATISSQPKEPHGELELKRSGGAYMLEVDGSGDFTYETEFQLPFKKEAGSISFTLPMANSLRNSVSVDTDRDFMEIVSPNAMHLSSELSGKFWKASASFAPGADAKFVLRPQQRNVQEEAVQYFAVVDGIARFMPGSVETTFICGIQIAQGEALKFRVSIPKNMRVSSVEGQDVGAWKADTAKCSLDVELSRPHTGSYALTIVAQTKDCNLPCKAALSPISFPDASKQHGSIGVFADSAVQLQVLTSKGMSLINNTDFVPGQRRAGASLKKAYRYFNPQCSLEVEATAVKPEIRVSESVEMRCEEERTTISSALDVDIAKAGVFSVTLKIPDGFDIDKLSGDGIQHWDEFTEPRNHRVVVNFNRRMTGHVPIQLELKKDARMKGGSSAVPRIDVVSAVRLTGELSISVERGVRMDVLKRQGVEPKPSPLSKSFKNSVHCFSIQRVDWLLEVAFSSADPWIQADYMQTAKITEGWAECEAAFQCSIENAGVKKFKVKLPDAAESVEFDGQSISFFSSPSKGVWEVELSQKTGRDYKLSCRYRLPFNGSKISLPTALLLDVQNQTGYYAIVSEESGEIKLESKSGDAIEYDARKLPAQFKRQGGASGATLCYRTVGDGCTFNIETIRHKTAATLQAEIKSASLLSVAGMDGMLVTKADVQVDNGNQNFLKVTLPKGGNLWSVFIDSQPVDAAMEGQAMLIPLKQGFGCRRAQSVEFIYSLSPHKGWKQDAQLYAGPSFELPLQNLSWIFAMPDNFNYSGFKGNLDYVEEPFMRKVMPQAFNIGDYDVRSKSMQDQKQDMAKQLLDRGNKFSQQGRPEAFEAYQSAMNLSENDTGLNSDIQGQWLETQREQNVQSIANRRIGINNKYNLNTTNQAPQQADQQQMRFESMDQIKSQFGGAELKSLQAISDKIFMQQRAATVVTHPLEITLPEKGVMLRFERALQANTGVPMEVSFHASKNFEWKYWWIVLAGAVFTVASFLALGAFALSAKRTIINRV